MNAVATAETPKRHGLWKHGSFRNPTWRSWSAMKARCDGKTRDNSRYYSLRGITYCERWKSFENFLADMGERPPGMSLDRIDVNGNYEPGNCRWATPEQQHTNTRQNVRLTLNGETLTMGQWARRLGCKTNTIWMRLYRYNWPLEKALTTPARQANARMVP